MTHDTDERARGDREGLSYHDQMLAAQDECVPCKLCGGKAVISDAGEGAGYYIQCGNSRSFRGSKGCMIDARRLGGWAFNVSDWWNRLHTDSALAAGRARTVATMTREERVNVATVYTYKAGLEEGAREMRERCASYLDGYAGGHYMAQSCAARIRALPADPSGADEGRTG